MHSAESSEQRSYLLFVFPRMEKMGKKDCVNRSSQLLPAPGRAKYVGANAISGIQVK